MRKTLAALSFGAILLCALGLAVILIAFGPGMALPVLLSCSLLFLPWILVLPRAPAAISAAGDRYLPPARAPPVS